MSKKESKREDFPVGNVISFSNWNKPVELARHGKRERYDNDLKMFQESSAKTAQVSVTDVKLDSLSSALKARYNKTGFI